MMLSHECHLETQRIRYVDINLYLFTITTSSRFDGELANSRSYLAKEY
jgi:hypothetical protein